VSENGVPTITVSGESERATTTAREALNQAVNKSISDTTPHRGGLVSGFRKKKKK